MSVLSVHLADVPLAAAPRVLRDPPRSGAVPGLRYGETVVAAPLGGGWLPRPNPRRIGLIASWENEQALDGFLDSDHELAARLASGWRVRLEPLRCSGSWSPLPELQRPLAAGDPDEPVAVLTLGRLRLTRALRFLRVNAPAQEQAVHHPAFLAGTGLAHPPALVATFSLWRSAAEMETYAYDQRGGHLAAVGSHRASPLHHESAFIRLRPYAEQGSWDGRQPLALGAHA